MSSHPPLYLLQALQEVATTGVCFENKTVLLTGCGKDSIGLEVLQAVLAGGGKAVVTTSSYSRQVCQFYCGVYQRHGAKGSGLTVCPFNGGSVQDVEALVEYIYSQPGWDIDVILPFAATPERGIEAMELGSQSELAHRLMLTNVLRLLGAVKVWIGRTGLHSTNTYKYTSGTPKHNTAHHTNCILISTPTNTAVSVSVSVSLSVPASVLASVSVCVFGVWVCVLPVCDHLSCWCR